MQEESEHNAEFKRRTDGLSELTGLSLRDLGPRIGISPAMLFSYRSGKNRITSKAWGKLKAAEEGAGIKSDDFSRDKPTSYERAILHDHPMERSSSLELISDIANSVFPSNPKASQALFDYLCEMGFNYKELDKGLRLTNSKLDVLLDGLERHMECFELPLAGAVSAGDPIEAVEVGKMFRVARNYGEGSELYIVMGHAMNDTIHRIVDGTLIVVRPAATATHYDRVVAVWNDERIFRRLIKRDGEMLLKCDNDNYVELIPLNEARIIGVFVSIAELYDRSPKSDGERRFG